MAAAASAVVPSRKVSALEKLISDEPETGIERPHPLLANRLYTKVGQNRLFEVRPGVLHFSGFKPNQLHRQVVRVVNRTSQSQSVNIIGTTTPYFKVSCRKRGAVAPGMAEEIFVEFTPTEWRYYCDCIRLHNDDENLVIPVHAYPTMAEAFFPKHVDFGRCQLGKRYSKTVKLHSSIPVQFEFRVEVLQPLPEVSVEPLEGIIPPNGPATITVHFLPARLSTYSAQIRVSLSQFNSEPVICTVTGSGFPGLNRPAALDAQQDQRAQSSPVAVMQRAEKRIQEQRMKILQRGPSETQRELNVLRTEGIDELLGDGLGDVQLGTNLHAHGKVNAVLTEGGLSVKSTCSRSKKRGGGDDDDIMTMNGTADIRSLRLEDTARSQASGTRRYEDAGSIVDDTLGETKYGVYPAEDVTVYDDENVSESLKHALFEAQLRKFLGNEKSKSLSIKVNVGEVAVSDEEVALVMKKRALLENEKMMRELDEAVDRREPEVVPPDEGCVLVMSDERESISGSYEPLFNKFDADKGALKTRVLQRFRSAVNRVIVQVRTVNRFRRIRELLAKANFDGDVAEDMSKMEIQASVGEDGPLEETIRKVATMKIRIADPFPYRGGEDESYATCLHPVALTSVSDPDPRREFAMAEMQRYKVMGYELQEFDAVDTNAPPMAPSILLEGAAEESPSLMRTVAPQKDSQEEEASTDEQETASALDHTQLRVPDLASPSPLPPEIKVIDGSLMTVPPRWGVDEGYLLEPKALASSTEHADIGGGATGSCNSSGEGVAGVSSTSTAPDAGVGSSTKISLDSKSGPAMTSVTEPCWLNSVSSLSGRPKLSDIWWPRIEPWFNIPELPPMMEGPRKEDLVHLADDSADSMIGPLPGVLHDPMARSSPAPKFTLETVKEMFALSDEKNSDEAEDTKGGDTSVVKPSPPPAAATTKSSASAAAASSKSSSGAVTGKAAGKSSGAGSKSSGGKTSSSAAAVAPVEPVFSGKAIAEAIRGETSHKLIEKLDKLLVELRSKQLEEVVERKRKVNSLLKDPSLRI